MQPDEPTLDDAIAWCLSERDSGTHVDEQVAVDTFPQFADEIRSFLQKEGKIEQTLNEPPRKIAAISRESFGKYEIREKVGEGTFGHVYLGWDTELHRKVALKLARFTFGEEVLRSRFLNEARATAQLQHPNIVRMYDFGEIDETAFLALEFIEGPTLSKWADGPVETTKATQVVLDIVDALVHAHSRGVVHRDLTPKNIIMDAKDNPNILDFGLAKRILHDSTLLLQGSVVGTPSYVSPEQVSGKAHEVDGRSDIYSVGVILYELLSGVRPHDGALELLLHQIQFEPAAYLSDVKPSVPTELADICKKCLEKRPEDRYATAEGLRESLLSFMQNPSYEAGSTKPQRRWTRWAIGAAIATAAMLFVAWKTGYLTNETVIPPAPPITAGTLDPTLERTSKNPGFDRQGEGWNPSGRNTPISECIANRNWSPDPTVPSESTFESTFLSLPSGSKRLGYHQPVDLDSDAKFHVVRCYAAAEGGWASFGVTYYTRVDGTEKPIRRFSQPIRSPSTSTRGDGDGLTLHQFGCQVPEDATFAMIFVWREHPTGSDVDIDELALYEYTPRANKNRVLNGEFTIGEYDETTDLEK